MVQKRRLVRQSLPDVIAEDLRDRILTGDLIEGELIRQEALAEEYDVSRMPIREALKRLDSEGHVVFINNKGATVTKHSIAEIIEIFNIRTLLETDLFKTAIPLMTEKHFEACESLLNEMDASYISGNVAEWGPLNAKYHNLLYAAAEQKLTNQLLDRVGFQANRYVGMHIDKLIKADDAAKDHRALLAFARERNIEGAVNLLRSHIENSKLQIIDYITKQREQSYQ